MSVINDVIKHQYLSVMLLMGLIALALPSQAADEADPFEATNRKIFAFNDFMDRNLLRPVAKTYKFITPTPVSRGITNVYLNATDSLVIVNDVAQAKFSQGASDVARFIINSTVGFFGVFDVATHIGLEKHDEDFGQTLGVWGVPQGPYLMLPFLGPSSARNLGGTVIGYASQLGPSYFGDGWEEDAAITSLRIIDLRASFLDADSLISGDRYLFIRSSYLQRREFLINDGVDENAFEDEYDIFNDEEF
ncbi:MAG: VacJ family lipoprotein [Oleibacter sp.]|nr:VacJ family lipoprotein [Thalassolituus sp.]